MSDAGHAGARPGLREPGAGSPPELEFSVVGVEVEPSAAVPTLVFRITVTTPAPVPIRSIVIAVQLRIAAERRRYDPPTQERLAEIFGTSGQWASALGSLPWAQTTITVPPFTGMTEVDIPVACTYDFDVVAAKYLAALSDGDIPVELLFAGSVFYAAPDGRLLVSFVPWDRIAPFRVPVATWRAAIDRSFPDSAWIRMPRETLRRLQAFRSRSGMTTWAETVDALLDGRE